MMCLLFTVYVYLLFTCTLCFNIEDAKIFGHRGGIRGLVPESSKLSFSIGAQSNADYLELDIGSSKDGELIVIHDIILDHMTDIYDHPEFALRREAFNFSCMEHNIHTPSRDHLYCDNDGFYVFNFTLSELKTLKLRAREPYFNPHNPLNDAFEILTFREFLYLVNNLSVVLNRSIGITPELKSAPLFRSLGLDLEYKYMELLYETGFVHKNNSFYETNYFFKTEQSDPWPLLIVQSDSFTALSIVGNLSNNVYSSQTMKENVPLQFGIYAEDDLDWKLINWANTFSGGVNIPWTYADQYYSLLQDNDNVNINVHFRLEDFVPGSHQYSEQYTRNQYFRALNYRSLYGLDAIFSDNVQDLQSTISMLKEISNSSSLIYTQTHELVDSDAIIKGLGVQLDEEKNNSKALLGFLTTLIILYIVTVIVFIWLYKKRRDISGSYTGLEALEHVETTNID